MKWQAETYDSWFDEPWGKYAYSVELASALHGLGDLAGCRVLDAGCGTGRLLASLSGTATEAAVVGLDRDSAMLGVASGKKLGPLLQGDIMALPFPRASFDKTVAMTVLEFAADPAAAIGELCRVTRPGGRVVIGALSPNSPWGLAHRRELRQSPWDRAKFLKGHQLQVMARPYGLVSAQSSLLAPCALPGLAWWGRALEAIGRLAPRTGAFQVLTITISGR